MLNKLNQNYYSSLTLWMDSLLSSLGLLLEYGDIFLENFANKKKKIIESHGTTA